MFCANTRPVPVASTDLGEIAPVIVVASESGRSIAGGSGIVVVVTGGDVVVVGMVVEVRELASVVDGCELELVVSWL
jgi:hypothetical protein